MSDASAIKEAVITGLEAAGVELLNQDQTAAKVIHSLEKHYVVVPVSLLDSLFTQFLDNAYGVNCWSHEEAIDLMGIWEDITGHQPENDLVEQSFTP